MAEVARRGVVAWLRGRARRGARGLQDRARDRREWHVRHQAAFQKHTDNGVSKTINLPESATEADVARGLPAWPGSWAASGITVFRDGCKGGQVLNVGAAGRRRRPRRRRRARASSRGRTACTGRHVPDGDADRHRLHHRQRARRRRAVRGLRAGGQGGIGHDGGGGGPRPARLPRAAPAVPAVRRGAPRGGRSASSRSSAAASPPASGRPRCSRSPTRSRACSAEHIGTQRARRGARSGAGGRPAAGGGDLCRSAARPRSSTRKGARSASRAASTSATAGSPRGRPVMFSGGDYDEVARWLGNFVRSHAKRENLRVEAVVEAEGAREGAELRRALAPRRAAAPRPRPSAASSWASPKWPGTAGASRGAAASPDRVRKLAREFSPAGSPPRVAPPDPVGRRRPSAGGPPATGTRSSASRSTT